MDRIDTNNIRTALSNLRAGATPVARTELVRKIEQDTRSPATAGSAIGLSAGAEPPVDADRVSEIRQAVEEGRYPIVPAKIADAMIAAGFMLRIKA